MSHYIQAEIVDAVMAEYQRLHLKDPTVDHDRKMQLAKGYVRAIAIADTAILFAKLGIKL